MIHPATTGTPSRIGYPSPRVHCANDSGRHITANGAPSSVTTRLTSMPDCSPRAIARAYPSARTSNVNCCPESHAALSPSQAITSLRPLYERPTLYNSSNPSSTDTPNANVPPLMSARLSATSGRASRIRSRDFTAGDDRTDCLHVAIGDAAHERIHCITHRYIRRQISACVIRTRDASRTSRSYRHDHRHKPNRSPQCSTKHMNHGVTFNVTKDVFGSTLVTIDENGALRLSFE